MPVFPEAPTPDREEDAGIHPIGNPAAVEIGLAGFAAFPLREEDPEIPSVRGRITVELRWGTPLLPERRG